MNYNRPLSVETDPEKISEIIREQIEREKQARVSEEILHHRTLSPEIFLRSKLVTKHRYYGTN